jgi:transitional endoplasmic reticulum ATPase
VLVLTARLNLSAVDNRNGVVRLHRETMTALGLAPLDVVRLTGTRTTGAVVALAPASLPPDQVLVEELTLSNVAARDGDQVQVEAAVALTASSVTVSGQAGVQSSLTPDLVRSTLVGKVVTAGDSVSFTPLPFAAGAGTDLAQAWQSIRQLLGYVAQTEVLHVEEVQPPGPAVIGPGTVVGWANGTTTTGSATPTVASSAPPRVTELPGLEKQAATLKEWLDLGFHQQDLLARLGTSARLGILLSGPAGSGKATLVAAVAAQVGARFVTAWGPELAATEVNAAVTRLRQLLTPSSTPTVVLLEDVEAVTGPLHTAFVGLLKAAVATGRIAVVCATTRPEAVDPGLRAPDLLDHELAIALPDAGVRQRVLQSLTSALPLDGVDLADVAARTPGFVAADLAALLREAGLHAALRQRSSESPVVGAEDFTAALETVRPTSMAGDSVQLGGLTLDDVGDMVEVKQALTEAVLWPLQFPDTFSRLGVEAPRGVLLYGPPGCGKTFLVRAVAGSGQANVLSVKGAELMSKWVGESEAAVRDLFRRAREAAPALVFLDEVDALAPRRGGSTDGGTADRVVAALLTEMDGVEALRDVVVVGATNRPDLIDPALLRPGRLERLVFVPPPDADARAAILRAAAKDVPLGPTVDLEEIGRRTDGFSAADCAALIREAALTAMRESMSATEVTDAHLSAALTTVRPSLDPAQVAQLATYADRREQR